MGSIGSLNNTYLPQIGVSEVEPWRALLTTPHAEQLHRCPECHEVCGLGCENGHHDIDGEFWCRHCTDTEKRKRAQAEPVCVWRQDKAIGGWYSVTCKTTGQWEKPSGTCRRCGKRIKTEVDG